MDQFELWQFLEAGDALPPNIGQNRLELDYSDITFEECMQWRFSDVARILRFEGEDIFEKLSWAVAAKQEALAHLYTGVQLAQWERFIAYMPFVFSFLRDMPTLNDMEQVQTAIWNGMVTGNSRTGLPLTLEVVYGHHPLVNYSQFGIRNSTRVVNGESVLAHEWRHANAFTSVTGRDTAIYIIPNVRRRSNLLEVNDRFGGRAVFETHGFRVGRDEGAAILLAPLIPSYNDIIKAFACDPSFTSTQLADKDIYLVLTDITQATVRSRLLTPEMIASCISAETVRNELYTGRYSAIDPGKLRFVHIPGDLNDWLMQAPLTDLA